MTGRSLVQAALSMYRRRIELQVSKSTSISRLFHRFVLTTNRVMGTELLVNTKMSKRGGRGRKYGEMRSEVIVAHATVLDHAIIADH